MPHSIDNSAPYSSGAGYGMYVNGPLDTQYGRVFSTSGQYGSVPGNAMIGAQGQRAGRRRSKNKSKKRGGSCSKRYGGKKRNKSMKNRKSKGGFGILPGYILNQAITPATLLAMQAKYQKKKFN